MLFLSNSVYPSLKVNNSLWQENTCSISFQNSGQEIISEFGPTLASPAFVVWWGMMIVDVIRLAVSQYRSPPLCRSVDVSCATCLLWDREQRGVWEAISLLKHTRKTGPESLPSPPLLFQLTSCTDRWPYSVSWSTFSARPKKQQIHPGLVCSRHFWTLA